MINAPLQYAINTTDEVTGIRLAFFCCKTIHFNTKNNYFVNLISL